MIYSLTQRYDYFLIWGNGLKYTDGIIRMIECEKNLAIKKIYLHSPKSMKKLVKEVYSFDYAPLNHLKAKTEYLLHTVPEVMYVFVINYRPDEYEVGEGAYRHIESQTIRRVKESIRDKFNTRKNDRRSENHVVHASDNEEQTIRALQYLGLNKSVMQGQPPYDVPHHLGKISKYTVHEVLLEKLLINVLIDGKGCKTSIFESPHYRALTEDMEIYSDYLKRYRGKELTDYYSVDKFTELFQTFDYNKYIDSARYLVCKKEDFGCVILDGAHRASVMLAKGYDAVPVLEIDR